MIRKKRAIYNGVKYRRVSFNEYTDHTVCNIVNCASGELSNYGPWIIASGSKICLECKLVRRILYANYRSCKYSYVYDN